MGDPAQPPDGIERIAEVRHAGIREELLTQQNHGRRPDDENAEQPILTRRPVERHRGASVGLREGASGRQRLPSEQDREGGNRQACAGRNGNVKRAHAPIQTACKIDDEGEGAKCGRGNVGCGCEPARRHPRETTHPLKRGHQTCRNRGMADDRVTREENDDRHRGHAGAGARAQAQGANAPFHAAGAIDENGQACQQKECRIGGQREAASPGAPVMRHQEFPATVGPTIARPTRGRDLPSKASEES